MSTGPRRKLADALVDALALRDLFAGTFERWEIAGSVRRQRAFVSDCDHVLIPKTGEIRVPGMLMPQDGSLVWQRSDELLEAGTIQRATYGDSATTRWGPKLRGLVFRGGKHELHVADPKNWGGVLCMKTGPAEFSEHVVTCLKQGGRFRQQDGYLRRVGGPNAGEIVEVVDDMVYLKWAGLPELNPEERDAWWMNRHQRSGSR